MAVKRDIDTRRESVTQTVKRLRKGSGLTQDTVAKALQARGVNISRSQFAKVERGERNLEFAEASVLAEVLNVPLTGLIPHTDSDTPTHLWEELSQSNNNAQEASERLRLAIEAFGRRLGRTAKIEGHEPISEIHELHERTYSDSQKINTALEEIQTAINSQREKLTEQRVAAMYEQQPNNTEG